MSNDDEFGLYDDLDDAFTQPLEKDLERLKAEQESKLAAEKENETKLIAKDQKINDLEKEIEKLKKWDRKAEENFSVLCLTCKSELER
jgi:septal ring factor EnvC (AmiA/AmiB activator)